MISGKGRVWPSSFTFARNVLAKTNAETGRLANGVELSATRFAPPTPPPYPRVRKSKTRNAPRGFN